MPSTDLHINLFSTYVFLIPLFVGILSELTKLIVESVRKGRFVFERFLQAGGFPSTHSAFVTSLLIVVWQKEGLESVEFAIASVFAGLIWYDAFHARREIGLQAEALNRLQHWKQFSTHVGHSFVEVLGGIGFGALVTWLGIWLST